MNRWELRFENFLQAFEELEKAIQISTLGFLELAGLIKLYELSFELGWKVLKDFEEDIEKIQISGSPRSVIFAGRDIKIFSESEAEVWLEALESRNFLSNTYNETLAKTGEWKIRNQYYPMLLRFNMQFKALR